MLSGFRHSLAHQERPSNGTAGDQAAIGRFPANTERLRAERVGVSIGFVDAPVSYLVVIRLVVRGVLGPPLVPSRSKVLATVLSLTPIARAMARSLIPSSRSCAALWRIARSRVLNPRRRLLRRAGSQRRFEFFASASTVTGSSGWEILGYSPRCSCLSLDPPKGWGGSVRG